VVFAVVCGGLGLALAMRRGWRGTSPPISVPATALRLAVGQVVLFGVLETVERLAVGGHPISFLTTPQFALGVVLQVAVAVAAAVLLRTVERGARLVAGALRRPRRSGECRQTWALPADDAVVRWWGISGDARGPPPALPA
jgi:hypothetical protein